MDPKNRFEERIVRSQAPTDSCVARIDGRPVSLTPPPAAPIRPQRPGVLRKTEPPTAPSRTAPSADLPAPSVHGTKECSPAPGPVEPVPKERNDLPARGLHRLSAAGTRPQGNAKGTKRPCTAPPDQLAEPWE